jgi:hypothetical protein
MMDPTNLAEVQPVRRGENEAADDADADLERFAPDGVTPERGRDQRSEAAGPEQYETQATMHAKPEPEPCETRRYDEPQHQRVEVIRVAERNGGNRQHRNDDRNGQTMHDADSRQGDCDLIEKVPGQDHGRASIPQFDATQSIFGSHREGRQWSYATEPY